jgi:hypothetical protein
MAGILGDILDTVSGGGYGQAQGISKDMLEQAQNIPLPILKEYYPELYQVVASMNPELETAESLGPSKMEGIATDPALRTAQMNALNKLTSIGDAGGRDAQFLADQARLESDVNTNLQGQQGAIQQNMASRGMSGGMSEMVAKNMNAQQAANRQAQMGMDAKAQAEQRALSAIMQGGQLGGQMQAQDFSQKSQQAQAADMINKFNAQNRQDVQSRNVGAKNTAQQYNVGNQQGIADKNVGQKNNAQQYNLNLAQQQYDNEMKKRGLVTGAQKDLANSYGQEADRNRQFIGGLISSGSKAAGAGV